MPSRFKTISPNTRHTDALIQLGTDIYTTVLPLATEGSELKGTLPSIAAVLERITVLKSRHTKGSFAEIVSHTDWKRSKLYSLVVSNLEDDIDFVDEDPRAAEAAETILPTVKATLVNTKASFAEESAQLTRFIIAMEPFAEQIAKTSAAKRFMQLKKVETEFEKLRTSQTEERSQQIRGELQPELKILAFELNSVLGYVEYKARVSTGVFETAAAKIETLINAYLTAVKASKTRKESAKANANE